MKYILNFLIISFLILFTGCSREKLLSTAIEYQRGSSGLEAKSLHLSYGEITFLENTAQSESTVILLHGFGGDKDNWNEFVKELNNKYHIIAIDLLGHGKSTLSPDNNYTISNQVKMLNEFVSTKKITKVHLVGNSMGGAIALKYSHDYPKWVETLTLIDSLGMKATNSAIDNKIAKFGKNPLLNICTKESYNRLLHYGMEQPPYVPGIFTDILVNEKCKRKTLEKIIYKQIYKDSNLTMQAEEINLKTLIIWGDKDRIFHVNNANLFHRTIKNSKLIILKNIGHVPQLEAPDITANTFTYFIEHQ